jgi:dipeptidyl-peptidase-4
MTLMCLGSGNAFAAGVAIAPVSDWRLYDNVYTERFMRTPKENYDGYNKSSAIARASKLNGNLLIIHGTGDDNVHFQNSIRYIDALIDAGKSCDFAPMPDRDHSMRDGKSRLYVYNRSISHFMKYLKDGK